MSLRYPTPSLRMQRLAAMPAALLLLATAAMAQAPKTPVLHFADQKAHAQALREASRQMLDALGRFNPIAACGGGTGPKIPGPLAAYRRQVFAGAGATRLMPDKIDLIGKRCDEADLQSLQATTQLLVAMATLKNQHPVLAPDLVITPLSSDEAKRLSLGLGLALATLGPGSPVKPARPGLPAVR